MALVLNGTPENDVITGVEKRLKNQQKKNDFAFAALKTDGSVVSWGGSVGGGDTSVVADKLTGGVGDVFSSGSAFAALKTDGSVVCWGASFGGGDSSAVATKLTANVKEIFSTESAFAALKTDGSVVAWADSTKIMF